MDSYLIAGKRGEPSNLRISITNIPEFKELIERAQKEVEQLLKTVDKLSCFEINIELSTNVKEETKQKPQNGAFSAKINTLPTENYYE